MKIRLISDLHLDHLNLSAQNALVEQIREACIEPCDVLVFAGDLYDGSSQNNFLSELENWRKHSNAKLCIAVQGNHDFWGTSMSTQYTLGRRKLLRYEDTVLLENSACICSVNGEILRVYGGTGWFPPTVNAQIRKSGFADFIEIEKFEPFEQNKAFKQQLKQQSPPPDLVISHHVPMASLQDKRFRNHVDNCFFVGDLIDNQTPDTTLWCYGHTHTKSLQVQMGCTFVCNPLGYPYENMQGTHKPYKPMELNVQTVPLQRFEAVDVQV